jgi:hypothetical protein
MEYFSFRWAVLLLSGRHPRPSKESLTKTKVGDSIHSTMPSQKRSDQPNERAKVFTVGDRIRVNLHTGRIVEATIKAVINRNDGPRLHVDFGKDETALI